MRSLVRIAIGIGKGSKGLATTALLLALLAGPAHAFSLKPTLTELGGGVFFPEDKTFQKFYNGHFKDTNKPDKRVPSFRVTAGWFIYRIVSISISGGYMYASGFGLEPRSEDPADYTYSDRTGDWSGLYAFKKRVETPTLGDRYNYSDRTKDLYALTVFPIQADFRLNLHILRNQWVIPYGVVGVDEVIARSSHRQLDSERYWFEKRGWHYGGGVMLLMDELDRFHADKMEDEWGISDTYLTVDARKGTIRDIDPAERSQYDFSDWSYVAEGLRYDVSKRPKPQHDFSGWTYVASLTFRLKP